MSYADVQFAEKRSYADWGLKLESINLSFPEAKEEQIDIPGANGILDLSEVNGQICYKNRTLTLGFSLMDDYVEWHDLCSQIARVLHGKAIRCILPDDPNYYYDGRFSLQTSKGNDVDADFVIISDNYQALQTYSEGRKVYDHEIDTHIFNQAFLDKVDSYSPDLIVLAGFLLRIPDALLHAYPDKIINIHPALLPKFGGKGMYGDRVHEAVVMAGESESGITIHYIDEHYDEGCTVFQAKCPVLPGDTPADVAKKVHALEYEWFPKIIERVVNSL